jgi:hypothetical protein
MKRYTRLAPGDSAVQADSRTAVYTFSDESVGRDGHIVRASAWHVQNFQKNPVFLWCHDDSVPAIGRVFDLHTVGRDLVGSVKYASTEFADSVFELVRGGFLNATSTSWQPLEFERMDSGSGLIFTSVDLLEISQVNVPALPSALIKAGARGLNLKPMREWASRALDTSTPRIPRHDVEAIYRAAAGTTRSQRRRQAQAIAERVRADDAAAPLGPDATFEDRLRRARAVRARIIREDAP